MAKTEPRNISEYFLCDVGEIPTESIENFSYYRDTFVNIPVEDDQDGPELRDSTISINFYFFGTL